MEERGKEHMVSEAEERDIFDRASEIRQIQCTS